jgi:hypothetical protein
VLPDALNGCDDDVLGDDVNRFLGIAPKTRRDLSIEQIESALNNLEKIADTVESDVRVRIG